MTGFAGTRREARAAYVSPYPFEFTEGGLGVALACSTSSARGELAGQGASLLITNVGQEPAYLAFGGDDVVATTSYLAVLPGTQIVITMPDEDDVTHVAGITASSTTTVQISRGWGG